ncbi:MAG: methyltransferase domain-containing protein [Firmicutes bacterium]|nr:methyltransferase domain-containing protein [Bacillota bacterium]
MAEAFDRDWFERAWEETGRQDEAATAAVWDREAPRWDRRARQEQAFSPRLRDTVAWLEQRGLLGPELDAADIGCGPGRFAAEFARRCRQVLAVDVSGQMLEFGRRYAAEQGLTNIEFAEADFSAADVAELGWAGRFDLAFSAITPAIRGRRGLDNLIAVSRAWCCNYSFVYNVNGLHDRLLEQVFSRPPQRCKTSHSQWFHELFNLLWLRGYYPRVDYYQEHREQGLPADRETAADLRRRLLPPELQTEDSLSRILAFLEREADGRGLVPEISDCWFGILLWDVREQGLDGRVER